MLLTLSPNYTGVVSGAMSRKRIALSCDHHSLAMYALMTHAHQPWVITTLAGGSVG